MKTITIPITLPEDIALQAEEKGLLTSTSVAMLVCDALKVEQNASTKEADFPPDFDPRLRRLVDPGQYRKGKIVGDIVEPLDMSTWFGRPNSDNTGQAHFPLVYSSTGKNPGEDFECYRKRAEIWIIRDILMGNRNAFRA